MPSFSNKKQLRFVITLGTGKFGSSNNDQITLQGFRAIADIDKAGGMMMGTLRAKIFGVKQVDMNSVTTLQWKPGTLIPNTVEVFAIDGAAETLVFAGNIVNAWADYQSMPDVYLHIQAQSAFFNALKAIPPRSFKGGVDVASVMAQIARDLGYTFENNGVTTQLIDVYLPNTGMEQAKDLARAAGCDLYLDDKILAITPPNVPRKVIIPLISPASGLVGYPTFDGVGVNFQTLFNPAVTFGGSVKLETDVQQAAGEWVVTSVGHRLESEKPGGAWFSTIRGNQNGLAVTGR
jgi:hypothetical protein